MLGGDMHSHERLLVIRIGLQYESTGCCITGSANLDDLMKHKREIKTTDIWSIITFIRNVAGLQAMNFVFLCIQQVRNDTVFGRD